MLRSFCSGSRRARPIWAPHRSVLRSWVMDQRATPRHDLAAFEEAAAEVVTRGAVVLRDKLRGEIVVEFKDKRQRDPVTAVDRAVEALVRDELRGRFPEHGILGEEGTGEAITSEYLWVLDPLDGTAN